MMPVWGNANLIEIVWTLMFAWSLFRSRYLLQEAIDTDRALRHSPKKDELKSLLSSAMVLSGIKKVNTALVFMVCGILLALLQPEPVFPRSWVAWFVVWSFLWVGLVFAVTAEVEVYMRRKVRDKLNNG